MYPNEKRTEKARVNRARVYLHDLGFCLKKSRGSYRIIEYNSFAVVAGLDYDLDLDGVEEFITDRALEIRERDWWCTEWPTS